MRRTEESGNENTVEPVAHANEHVGHASCWRTSRACRARGISVTLARI